MNTLDETKLDKIMATLPKELVEAHVCALLLTILDRYSTSGAYGMATLFTLLVAYAEAHGIPKEKLCSIMRVSAANIEQTIDRERMN